MLFLMMLKIFFARIIDVSLGTFRTILTVKGKIYFPSIVAFFEVIIWFFVAKEALLIKSNSIFIPISYSLGYATGTLIGSLVSKHLINGFYEIKIYFYNNKVISYLKSINAKYYIVENINGNKLLITYLNKRCLKKKLNIIHRLCKRSIIYTSEANKLSKNNILQSENNML